MGSTSQEPCLVGGLNPSEKYESQLGWLFPIWENKKWQPNHQPVRNHVDALCHLYCWYLPIVPPLNPQHRDVSIRDVWPGWNPGCRWMFCFSAILDIFPSFLNVLAWTTERKITSSNGFPASHHHLTHLWRRMSQHLLGFFWHNTQNTQYDFVYAPILVEISSFLGNINIHKQINSHFLKFPLDSQNYAFSKGKVTNPMDMGPKWVSQETWLQICGPAMAWPISGGLVMGVPPAAGWFSFEMDEMMI